MNLLSTATRRDLLAIASAVEGKSFASPVLPAQLADTLAFVAFAENCVARVRSRQPSILHAPNLIQCSFFTTVAGIHVYIDFVATRVFVSDFAIAHIATCVFVFVIAIAHMPTRLFLKKVSWKAWKDQVVRAPRLSHKRKYKSGLMLLETLVLQHLKTLLQQLVLQPFQK